MKFALKTNVRLVLAITIFFAMLGMLSPASRGALLTAAIFFYEFLGLVAGYYSGRLYRTMKGKEWKVRANNHMIVLAGSHSQYY